MKPTLVLAVALTIACGTTPVASVPAFATDAPAPAASQAVQKYVLAVTGMT